MKLLKFQAVWCGPCSALSMTLKGMKHSLIETMEEIDIDKNLELAKKYNVRSVPTMVIVNDNGDELRRSTGAINKDKLEVFLS